MKGGGDIDKAVQEGILYADTFLVFGSAKYGEQTGNSACTYYESKFAQTQKKRIVLIRMLDFDEEFQYPQAKFMFGLNMLELPWLLNTPMPSGLVGQIADAMGLVEPTEMGVPLADEPELNPVARQRGPHPRAEGVLVDDSHPFRCCLDRPYVQLRSPPCNWSNTNRQSGLLWLALSALQACQADTGSVAQVRAEGDSLGGGIPQKDHCE